MRIRLSAVVVILVALLACQHKRMTSVPFAMQVAGLGVRFPLTIGSLLVTGEAQLHGIVILMPNKATKLDSVKRWLEQQLGKPMTPLIADHLDLRLESAYTMHAPVYTCVPSSGTHVSLRAGDFDHGGCKLWTTYQQTSLGAKRPPNILRLAINYGLAPDKEEQFAIGNGYSVWAESD